jgi:DNA-binding GntR family transcriptional regulator
MPEARRGAPSFFRLVTHSQAVSNRRASRSLQADNRIHDRIHFAMDCPYFDETMRSRIRMMILLHSYLWTLPASRNHLSLRAAFVGKRVTRW